MFGAPVQEPVQGEGSPACRPQRGSGGSFFIVLCVGSEWGERRPRATPSSCRPACSVFQTIGVEDADTEVDAVPEVQDTVQVIPGSRLLWRINTRPPNSAQVSASAYLPFQPHVHTSYLRPLSQSRQRTLHPLIRLSSV